MSRYLTEHEEANVVRLYGEGQTAREVGAFIGKSKTTILNVLRRRGVDRREPGSRETLAGSRNPNWRGGRYVDDQGYVHVWTPSGYQREHRLLSGAAPGEVVHRRDGNPANNSRDNLEVLQSHAAHRAEHVAEQRESLGKALHPAPMIGEANPRAKLTADQVAEIRSLRGVVSQAALGVRFGVSKTAIRYIQKGRNWKHLPREFPEART